MNLTIKTRLIIAFLLLIGLSASIYIMADRALNNLNDRLNTIVSSNAQRLVYNGQLSTDMQYNAVRIRDIIMSDDQAFIMESMNLREQRQKSLDRTVEELLKLQSEERQALTNEFIEVREQYDQVTNRIITAKLSGAADAEKTAMKILVEEGRPLVNKYTKIVDKLTKTNLKDLGKAAEETDVLYQETKNDMLDPQKLIQEIAKQLTIDI